MSTPLPTCAPDSPDAGLPPGYAEMRARVEGTNINPDTLLATDYLNHFNEVIMLLEMIADMPDMLAEVKDWQPKSYAEHFRDSGLSIGELAIEAYDYAPSRYRLAFERTIAQMTQVLARGIDNVEVATMTDHTETIRLAAQGASRTLQVLNDTASAIIHGGENTMDHEHIDEMMGHPRPAAETASEETAGDGLDQSDIDALFD